MLGAASSVFDPLGLVTPFTIQGKMLIQDLAREKSGWDEPLSDEHLVRWQEWLEEVSLSRNIRIERCLLTAEFGSGSIVHMELHHFSDASVAAYGAATYLRLVNSQGVIRCNLVYSRSRVAPMKKITIPRLELGAVALSVQQDQMIRKERNISISTENSFYWTNSVIVLAYKQNESERFHTYVANRLAVIHSGSTAEQWKHVRSAQKSG